MNFIKYIFCTEKKFWFKKKLQQLWYIICDNCETGDSGKVAHSSESGESGDVREYGDSDKTCDSGESDISSEYGESGELSESCEFCDFRINIWCFRSILLALLYEQCSSCSSGLW